MLKFSINDGVMTNLVVSGSLPDILTDVTALVSVLYGSLKRQNDEQADNFRSGLLSLFTDRTLHDKVFSTEYADMVEKSDMYKTSGGMTGIDIKELMKQLKDLKELLNIDEEDEEESDDESE